MRYIAEKYADQGTDLLGQTLQVGEHNRHWTRLLGEQQPVTLESQNLSTCSFAHGVNTAREIP